MPRIVAALKDPRTRPRAIIWSLVAAIAAVVLVLAIVGVTSTKWFCAAGCHKVQDDTITSYERSSHSEVSCMACHMPAGADPITFMLHKAMMAREVFTTVANRFELPINADSHLALSEEMGSGQCTQCHGDNRVVTPSRGVIIDHAIHADRDISCAVCHNRVAHREDFALELKDPGSGEPNRPHEDFMLMQGCFRCHTQAPGASGEATPAEVGSHGEPKLDFASFEAPGECDACHPSDFELRPDSHLLAGFYKRYGESKGHADLAKEDRAYCVMCHNEEAFCGGCHKLDMPHPKEFAKDHGEVGRSRLAVCANCHNKSGKPAGDTEFCNNCHHEGADPTKSWVSQHFVFVRDKGAGACFDCHKSTFCAECHVRGIAR